MGAQPAQAPRRTVMAPRSPPQGAGGRARGGQPEPALGPSQPAAVLLRRLFPHALSGAMLRVLPQHTLTPMPFQVPNARRPHAQHPRRQVTRTYEMHTHTHTHTHTRTAGTHTHTNAYTHTHINAYTRTRTHAHARTRAHAGCRTTSAPAPARAPSRTTCGRCRRPRPSPPPPPTCACGQRGCLPRGGRPTGTCAGPRPLRCTTSRPARRRWRSCSRRRCGGAGAGAGAAALLGGGALLLARPPPAASV